MRKKFYIIKEIDWDILDKEIDDYIERTNNNNPYIFMNENTIETIDYNVRPLLTDCRCNNKPFHGSRCSAVYNGYPIYINNSLDFGMVEVR